MSFTKDKILNKILWCVMFLLFMSSVMLYKFLGMANIYQQFYHLLWQWGLINFTGYLWFNVAMGD